MSSLADEYPKQQARCRELYAEYRSLPNGAGVFGAFHIAAVIERAEQAAMSGDVVAMLASFKEMQGCE